MKSVFNVSRLVVWSLFLLTGIPIGADDLGCHHDETTDSYFCDSGILEGREFLSRAEAEDAMQVAKAKIRAFEAERPDFALPPSPQEAETDKAKIAKTKKGSKEPGEGHLRVISWSMKALKSGGSDYDRAAIVMSDFDVIALQEVDLQGEGKGFLNVIGKLIQSKSRDKICKAWVQADGGGRQNYAYLWKERTIGYIDNDGQMKEACGDIALTIVQPKKMKLASQGMFYFKPLKKMFVLGSAFVESPAKVPEKHITELFKAFDEGKWPVMIGGDFKSSSSDRAFDGARKMGFHSALGGKKSVNNFWFRGVVVTKAEPLNLYERFAEVRHEDIARGFSGVFPIVSEFNLREEVPTDSLSMVVKERTVAKLSRDKKKSAGKPNRQPNQVAKKKTK